MKQVYGKFKHCKAWFFNKPLLSFPWKITLRLVRSFEDLYLLKNPPYKISLRYLTRSSTHLQIMCIMFSSFELKSYHLIESCAVKNVTSRPGSVLRVLLGRASSLRISPAMSTKNIASSVYQMFKKLYIFFSRWPYLKYRIRL